MAAVGSGASLARHQGGDPSAPGALLLVRIAAVGGATRSEIGNDLSPFFSHKMSPAEWRRTSERQIGQLIAGGFATETRSRLKLTDTGAAFVADFLGQKTLPARSWPELRDGALTAKGIGLERESATRLKALLRPEGLRSFIVQKAYGLSIKKNQPPAKLRAQLAVVALERAFGNKIKAGFGKGSPLSARAGRLLAGQLSLAPREFPSDAKLIAALAADQVGAANSDIDTLRLAIFRKLGAEALDKNNPEAPAKKAASAPHPVPAAANDRGPVALSPPKSYRPDLPEFARHVKTAAAARAEGWPGNRKAYISHVWEAIHSNAPSWDLSEIEFKCMLAEAHRLGAVVLANADLKNKSNMKELESSAVLYKNTVWHFVRVEE
jgi:hypothetical protein